MNLDKYDFEMKPRGKQPQNGKPRQFIMVDHYPSNVRETRAALQPQPSHKPQNRKVKNYKHQLGKQVNYSYKPSYQNQVRKSNKDYANDVFLNACLPNIAGIVFFVVTCILALALDGWWIMLITGVLSIVIPLVCPFIENKWNQNHAFNDLRNKGLAKFVVIGTLFIVDALPGIFVWILKKDAFLFFFTFLVFAILFTLLLINPSLKKKNSKYKLPFYPYSINTYAVMPISFAASISKDATSHIYVVHILSLLALLASLAILLFLFPTLLNHIRRR